MNKILCDSVDVSKQDNRNIYNALGSKRLRQFEESYLDDVDSYRCQPKDKLEKNRNIKLKPNKNRIAKHRLRNIKGNKIVHTPKAPHNTSSYLIANYNREKENKPHNYGELKTLDEYDEDLCVVGGTMKGKLPSSLLIELMSDSESAEVLSTQTSEVQETTKIENIEGYSNLINMRHFLEFSTPEREGKEEELLFPEIYF